MIAKNGKSRAVRFHGVSGVQAVINIAMELRNLLESVEAPKNEEDGETEVRATIKTATDPWELLRKAVRVYPKDGEHGKTVEWLDYSTPQTRNGSVYMVLCPKFLRGVDYFRFFSGEWFCRGERFDSCNLAAWPTGQPIRPIKVDAETKATTVVSASSPMVLIWATEQGWVNLNETRIVQSNGGLELVQTPLVQGYRSESFMVGCTGKRLVETIKEELTERNLEPGLAPAIAHALLKACGEIRTDTVFARTPYAEESDYLKFVAQAETKQETTGVTEAEALAATAATNGDATNIETVSAVVPAADPPAAYKVIEHPVRSKKKGKSVKAETKLVAA